MSIRTHGILLLTLTVASAARAEPDADAGAAASCATAIGTPCTASGGECGPAGFCLETDSGTKTGVCICPCTPDNPATLIDEDSCPDRAKHFCIEIQDGFSFCVQRCQPRFGANDCQAPLRCSQIPNTSLPGCFERGCIADADCPVLTGTDCTMDETACGAGETCWPLPSSKVRLCTKPGTCDTASGWCAGHAEFRPGAKVGDPCKADTDCGKNMGCMLELNPRAMGLREAGAPCTGRGQCCGSCQNNVCVGFCKVISARNGYCTLMGCAHHHTLPELDCPEGSVCNPFFVNGMCQKTCRLDVASDCRGHPADRAGDYECYAWNNLFIDIGIPFTPEPVCVPTAIFSPAVLGLETGLCALLAEWGADCDDLGLGVDEISGERNTTHMKCRLLDGTPTADPADPRGYCLDDTTSGPVLDAGVDAGPDAGPDAWLVPDWSPASDAPVDNGDGCHMSPGSGGRPPLALIVLLLLVIRRLCHSTRATRRLR